MVFIKQQSNSERRCFLVLVQQCLHRVPCLSVIFSPFSFLGENRNAPTYQICQILSLTSPSKLAASATFTLPLDLCEQQRTNENRPAWADAKCSSHFPLLCSVVVEKMALFAQRNYHLKPSQVPAGIETLLRCDTAKLTTLLHPELLSYIWSLCT